MRLHQKYFLWKSCSDVVAEFRLTVFRPFVGEVLTGRIMTATYTGIRISLEFFDDIFIPAHLIFSIASLYTPSKANSRITVVTTVHNHGNFLYLLQSLIILKKTISYDLKLRRKRSRKQRPLRLKLKKME